MSINLKKGQSINLKKSDGVNENNLSQITIGLGWDINENGKGEYDLDACALLLKNNSLESDRDIVYYGDKEHKSGTVWSTGDNLTGAGDGDDEQIIAKLNSIPSEYNKIVFYVSIYQGHSRNGQQLSDVQNAFIRAIDANGKEMLKYNMTGEHSMQGHCSYVFAEVVRNGNSWDFKAVGEAFKTDSYKQIAESYKGNQTENKKKLFGIF